MPRCGAERGGGLAPVPGERHGAPPESAAAASALRSGSSAALASQQPQARAVADWVHASEGAEWQGIGSEAEATDPHPEQARPP